MNLPNNYQIIEKNVKHARIRVSNDGSVRITVPQGFLQQDLTTLLQKNNPGLKNIKLFFGIKLRSIYNGINYYSTEIAIIIFINLLLLKLSLIIFIKPFKAILIY